MSAAKSHQNPLPPPTVAEGKLRGFDLSGRRLIVYGAESPLGGAIVDALREAGATVGVTSATTDGTALFALKKVAAGGPSAAVDMSNPTGVQVATRKLQKALTGLDGAVVLPASTLAAPLAKTTDVDLQRLLAGHLTATDNVFRSASRELVRGNQGGRLVALLSGVALAGLANAAALAAAQAGVLGLVRSLSQEFGPSGVTVNAIVTGWMEEAPGPAADEAQRDALRRFIPLQRFGRAIDVAPLVVYLCSNASGYLNGQVVAIDGGVLRRR